MEDKAIYECIASNEAGNVTKVITLIVYSECGLFPVLQPLAKISNENRASSVITRHPPCERSESVESGE